MIKIKELAELPFIEATVTFRGQKLKLENVLIDTGSAGSIFNVNKLEEIGVKPEANDELKRFKEQVDPEFVYTRNINEISINDEIAIQNFHVELGSMDYGLEIDGIIGYDFMKEVGLIIDLGQFNISIK